MAKTMNTAEPMDETPEVLEEITPEIREEIPSDPELVERPEITEDPDGPRTLEDEPEQLRTADESDVSPLADIDPATRIEFFLDEIATGLAELVPATRIEEFLHRIAVRLNTIYNYEPVIPDVSDADVNKVMTVVASTESTPAKWAPVLPPIIPGTGSNSGIGTYIGQGSSARPKATGAGAIALGAGTTASGVISAAIGQASIASARASFAGGAKSTSDNATTASGEESFAFGLSATAAGSGSVAMGLFAKSN